MKKRSKKRPESRKEYYKYVFRREIKLGNLLTLLNLASGFGAILASITENFKLALMLLVAALIFDLFDGSMARRAGKATAFGTEVDSLSDMVSFSLAPVIFAFMNCSTVLAVMAYIINISVSVFRLARFNVLNKIKYYIGVGAGINVFMIIFLYISKIPFTYWPAAFIISALLMASPFKIKKMH